MKTCSKCKDEKELKDFSKNSQSKDGHRPDCKECCKISAKKRYDALDREKVNAYVRARYPLVKESILANSRAFYHANLGKQRARSKAYREANAESIRERSKAYYAANKEKERARIDDWKKENPERTRAGRVKRRIQNYNAEHVYYTEQQVLDLYGICCHICGLEIDLNAPRRNNVLGWENGLHLDHVVPLAKGGADRIENVKPSHGVCNLSKGKR